MQTLAHELGHNLGLNHDFSNGNWKSPRFAHDSSPCTNVGGIMDYRSNAKKWTKCSADDFAAYYGQVIAGLYTSGKAGAYCLAGM